MQKGTLFEQVKENMLGQVSKILKLNMGREPIKSQAEFLRNQKVISGNQGLQKKHGGR